MNLMQQHWDLDNPCVLHIQGDNPSYLIKGRNGAQVKLTSSAYFLLRSVQSGASFAEIAETLNHADPQKNITDRQLKDKYDALLAQFDKIQEDVERQPSPWGFWMRRTLFPEAAVNRLSSALSHLFHPFLAAAIGAMVVVVLIAGMRSGFAFKFHPATLFSGYFFFILILCAHEFGHASACVRYGARPSEIGLTIYLIYPALYSDVSSAWSLTRRQRVVVDAAGLYFQAIASAAVLAAFYITRWEPLLAAVILSFYSALFSLNPIFKFDGYWALADFLGVPNLSSQPKRIATYVLDVVRNRPTNKLPWPPAVTTTLIAYSVLTVFVWTFFLLRLFPMLASQWNVFTRTLVRVAGSIRSGAIPAFADIALLLISGALSLFALVTLWKIVKQPLRAARLMVGRLAPTLLQRSKPHSIASGAPRLSE
jgi:putative peptide zinc metalloprotease protein